MKISVLGCGRWGSFIGWYFLMLAPLFVFMPLLFLGMGGFGLAIAVMLNNFGHDVTVWSAFKQEIPPDALKI